MSELWTIFKYKKLWKYLNYSSYYNRGIMVTDRTQNYQGLWQSIDSKKLQNIREQIYLKYFVSILDSIGEKIKVSISLRYLDSADGQTRYREIGSSTVSPKSNNDWFEIYGIFDIEKYQPVENYEFAIYVQLPDSLASFKIDHAYMAPVSDFEYLRGNNLITNGDFEFDFNSPFSTWTGHIQQELSADSPSGLAHLVVSFQSIIVARITTFVFQTADRTADWQGVTQILNYRDILLEEPIQLDFWGRFISPSQDRIRAKIFITQKDEDDVYVSMAIGCYTDSSEWDGYFYFIDHTVWSILPFVYFFNLKNSV